MQLALRVGNEQEEGATANTVGCCSLRVEHIALRELETDSEDSQFLVEFDFPGKDSVRYANTVRVDERVFRNLELFIEHKELKDDLFDLLTVSEPRCPGNRTSGYENFIHNLISNTQRPHCIESMQCDS